MGSIHPFPWPILPRAQVLQQLASLVSRSQGAHKMQREDVETHGPWAFIEASTLLPHACRWLRSEHGPGLVPSAYG